VRRDVIEVAGLGVIVEPVLWDAVVEEVTLRTMDHQIAGDTGELGRIGWQLGIAQDEGTRRGDAALGGVEGGGVRRETDGWHGWLPRRSVTWSAAVPELFTVPNSHRKCPEFRSCDMRPVASRPLPVREIALVYGPPGAQTSAPKSYAFQPGE
jgi:hypothetical protein